MNDPVLALALYAIYLGTAFAARSVLQLRATGSTGFHGVSGRPGSAEWAGGVLLAAALTLGVMAPALQLAGVVAPAAVLDTEAIAAVGAGLAVMGIALTLAAQSAMGRSWRIGVDPLERTQLVTSGPFTVVRNPVFAAMIPTGVGLALIAPNVVALIAVATLTLALQLQTRVVEEPYLRSAHGDDYAVYAARVGRFVPGLGKLRSTDRSAAA